MPLELVGPLSCHHSVWGWCHVYSAYIHFSDNVHDFNLHVYIAFINTRARVQGRLQALLSSS